MASEASPAMIPGGSALRRPDGWPFVLAMLVVFGVAGYLRWPGFGPSTLYLDDQWVVLLAVKASPQQWYELAAPIPHGVLSLLAVIGQFTGPHPTAMQAIPLAAALLALPATAWAVRQVTGQGSLGLLAAAALAVCPTFAIYSLRVKAYGFDVLATALLIGLTAKALLHDANAPLTNESRSAPRWRHPFCLLAVTAAIAPLFTFPAFLLGGFLLNATALNLLTGSRTADGRLTRRQLLIPLVVADLWLLALYLIDLRHHANAAMFAYWKDHYLPLSDPVAAVSFLADHGLALLAGPLPYGSPYLVPLVFLGLVAMMARKRTRTLGLTMAGFYLPLMLASAMGKYPLGAGRTDLFTYPMTVTLAAVGVQSLTRSLTRGVQASPSTHGSDALGPPPQRLRENLSASLHAFATAAVLIAALLGPRFGYPDGREKPLVEELTRQIQPHHALVVYAPTGLAVATWGPWPVTFTRSDALTHGYDITIQRPHTLVLPGQIDQTLHHEDPTMLAPPLRSFAQALPAEPPPLWYLATEAHPSPDQHLPVIAHTLFRTAGYRFQPVRTAPHGGLYRFVPPTPD